MRIYILPVLGLFALLFGCSQGQEGSPKFLGGLQPITTANVSPRGSVDGNPFSAQASVQKLIYHVGPTDVLSGQGAGQMIDKPATLNFQVSEPVWVISFQPKVLDANGRELPGRILHKALLLNKHDSNPVCASGSQGNPFAIATSTLTKVELPEGFGYPLLPEDPLEARVVFQNPTAQDYTNVTFVFELTAIPMDKTAGFNDVKTILLDTDPCEHKPISLEPGAFVEKSQTFTLAKGGNLMVANGLLSDFGVAVSLTHQNDGKATLVPFWRAEAQFDEDHQIINLTPNPFIDMIGKKIIDGDKLTLGVAFDNYSDNWNNAATGAAMLYLAPAE